MIKLRRNVKTSEEGRSLPAAHSKGQPFEEIVFGRQLSFA